MDNTEFIKLLKTQPNQALEYLYEQYYDILCNLVYMIIRSRDVSEDIVQELFLQIWHRRDDLIINTSLTGYLKRAARNRSLNYLRDLKIVFEDEDQLNNIADNNHNNEQYQIAQELETVIEQQILALPKKCGIVFALSRYEEMTYNEIAKELNISNKTVEHQISKALKILRNNIYK